MRAMLTLFRRAATLRAAAYFCRLPRQRMPCCDAMRAPRAAYDGCRAMFYFEMILMLRMLISMPLPLRGARYARCRCHC